MRNREPRVTYLTLASAIALLAVGHGDEVAAAQVWDAAQATQGLIVLGGFAIVLFVSLALLARTFSRLWKRPHIGVTEPKRRLDAHDDLPLIDVRSAEDSVGEQGHIAGAASDVCSSAERKT